MTIEEKLERDKEDRGARWLLTVGQLFGFLCILLNLIFGGASLWKQKPAEAAVAQVQSAPVRAPGADVPAPAAGQSVGAYIENNSWTWWVIGGVVLIFMFIIAPTGGGGESVTVKTTHYAGYSNTPTGYSETTIRK